MDALIVETDFLHDDSDKRDGFIQAFRKLSSANSANDSCHDVLKSLSSLQEKLTKGGQPTHKTKGWEQAVATYREISNYCKDILNRNRTAEPEAQQGFFSFTVQLLENGLSILHMQLAYDSCQDSNTKLKEYIQKLDEKSLKPLIKTVCVNVQEEQGVDRNEVFEMYQKFMRLLVRDTLTKDQARMFINELLDQTVYLYIDCAHFEEVSYKALVDTGKIIMNALDHPFKTIDDFSRIRSYMKRCGEVISQPNFPSSTVAASEIKDLIWNLISKLGPRGFVEELYNDVFDFILSITKCPYHEKNYDIQLFEEVYGFFRRQPDKTLSKNPDLFKAMAKRYIAVIEELDMRYLTSERFAYTVMYDVLYKVYADNKEVARQWLELLIPLYKKPCEDTMRAFYCIVSNDKGYKWKDHSDIAQQVFDLITSYEPPDDYVVTDEAEKKKTQEFLKNLKSALQYFFDGLKKSRMLKDYGKGMLSISLQLLESKSSELLELSAAIAERAELNPKEDKEFMVQMMNKFHNVLKNEDHLWNQSWPLQRAAIDFIDHCLEQFKDGKVFTDEDLTIFVSICLTCLKYECLHPETGQLGSVYFLIFLNVIKMLSKWLVALNKVNLAEELVPRLMKCLEVEDDSVTQLCSVYLYTFGQISSGQKVIAPYLDEIIQIYLDKRQDLLLQVISEIYPNNPKALKNHFCSLMDILEDASEHSLLTFLGMLFQKVSKKQAELFTEEDVEILLKKAQENVNSQSTLLEIVKELCKRRPEYMVPHIDLLLDRSSWSPMMSYWITDMLCTLALYREDLASKVLEDMFLTMKSNQDKSALITALNTIRMIGFKYPNLMKPRREQLDEIKLSDIDAINMRQTILDMIDGKTSADMLNKLQKQQEDIQDLIGRVDETEEAVAEVKDELAQQGEQLNSVKQEVNEQGHRVNQLEQTVDETVAKVEEIDQKTLSHAPFWARDVSKLLNPVSEHDWRLLSSRLGYSNDDIRGWAQQADPCMAMLNEWYATRKTSEATFAVLTQLQEMDRMDAAIIVENAMKNAEAVVEDEDFDYASPPPIFISYQWSHQPEIKLLKQHLEMAGYECWLDIGQMGGGDKLFEKIDKGIRAAKIIISCVTTKYAKSPNCNREVNLAVSLNKPVIPLLLESCPWPPPGSMGPIFSEYLFVRFFQRGGEGFADERYWPKEKFQELLMQLNMFGLPPNEEKIKPEYKNWWMPVVEEIKIDKSKTKDGGNAVQMEPSAADLKAAESPDVFISYQWGKQSNIIKLYERLTSLGLSCWLDIKQMGGGDSLYDKIDRGLRGCKVVVSCVTQKYALSANCRREVSLADALKKPLLPLLLEQMTWPPSGPMSMVMTQLLYINFTKDESTQMTWTGPQFEELINKIMKHVSFESNENNMMNASQNMKVSTNSVGGNSDGLSSEKIKESPINVAGTGESKPNGIQALKTISTSQNYLMKTAQPQPGIVEPVKPSVGKSQAKSTLPQNKELPFQSKSSAKKPIVTKVSSVSRLSSLEKPTTKSTPGYQARTEQLQLSVSSRRLLKPIQSDSLKNLPPSSSDIQIPVKTPVKTPTRTSIPQQSKISQRPTRLPPLQQAKPSVVQSSPVKQKQLNEHQLKVGGTTAQAKSTSK